MGQIPDFVGRPVGTLFLKGKKEGLLAYEPWQRENGGEEQRHAYVAAFRKVRDSEADALDAMTAAHEMDPTDALTSFHMERLEQGQSGIRVEFSQK